MSNQKVWYWDTSNISKESPSFDLNFPNACDFLKYNELVSWGHLTTEEEKKVLSELREQRIKMIDMLRRDYIPVPKENMPDMIYTIGKTPKGHELLDIFFTGAFVSNKIFVDILKKFRLGKTQIGEPMRLFSLNFNDYVNDTAYYCVNIAERHQYFLPKQMVDPSYHRNGFGAYYSPNYEEDFRLNYPISSKALDCPVDIWHDPMIGDSLFLSDNLAQALLQSGIDKNLLEFWECPLVEPQD